MSCDLTIFCSVRAIYAIPGGGGWYFQKNWAGLCGTPPETPISDHNLRFSLPYFRPVASILAQLAMLPNHEDKLIFSCSESTCVLTFKT